MLLSGDRHVLVVGRRDGATQSRLATTEILGIDTMAFSPEPLMSPGAQNAALSCYPFRSWWSVAAPMAPVR